AERAARKATRRRQHAAVDIVDVPQVPRPVNDALLMLSRLDRVVLARRDLPFGSSVFLAATRRD
ncbi:MAG TPA: class I SAM-dependent methyltransferase, partial [Ornithinibacter sp.]|nr:class I SAM-dependent methyltransferase [Ornithinibacter sp.]